LLINEIENNQPCSRQTSFDPVSVVIETLETSVVQLKGLARSYLLKELHQNITKDDYVCVLRKIKEEANYLKSHCDVAIQLNTLETPGI
jgi:hypothetical protein